MQECICKHTETNTEFSINVLDKIYTYKKCSYCQTYRMVNSPTLDEIINYYNNEKLIRITDSFKQAVRNTANQSIQYLIEYCIDHNIDRKKLLDVGCSEGTFVDVAKQNKFNAFGIDIADELITYGKSNGLTLENIDLLDYNETDFNVITFHDSLEHVYTPILYLEKAKSILTNKGALQITFPSYIYTLNPSQWEHARIDHNWLYSIYGLEQMLKKLDFKDFRIFDFRQGAYFSCVMLMCHN